MHVQVRRMVAEATAGTEAVLRENYQLLEKVTHPSTLPHHSTHLHNTRSPPQLAEALLEREVLNYTDMVELLGPLPHSKAHLHSPELADMW